MCLLFLDSISDLEFIFSGVWRDFIFTPGLSFTLLEKNSPIAFPLTFPSLFVPFNFAASWLRSSASNNMDEWKRSGQIPAFGDWDHANDMPITQYFESARQAGLVARYSSSGECGHHYMRGGDLYAAADFMRSSHNSIPHPGKTRLREKRETRMKEQRKQGRVCDVIEQPRKHHQQRPDPTISHNGKKNSNGDVTFARPRLTVVPPKPIDEDLYRIPPELLRTSKRKKVPGLFSCLVPTCAS